MFNFYYITKEDVNEHNPKWPEIPDHPYRILIIGGSGSGNKDAFICKRSIRNKILLINKRESTGLKYLIDSKAFIEYSKDMDDIYKNIEEYNPNKKRKILIVFDDVIADILSNKKLNPLVTELVIRGRKLNISFVFITQSYFCVSKNVRLNSTWYFVMKIQTKENFNKLCSIIRQILIFKAL